MAAVTTGAFISKDDPDMVPNDTYYEISLDLIKAYLQNQPDADRIRIYNGTYAGSDTLMSVLVQDGNILYYDATGAPEMLEHVKPVQV